MIRISKSLCRTTETYVINFKQFLSGKIAIKKYLDRIEFITPTDCYNGKLYTICKNGFCATSIDLPLGVFEFEKEEDKIIIYL